ncbi:MAG: hypothetical protein NVS3B1_28270 [Marmoricola sp.]
MHPREIERLLPDYEGLVFTTATRIVNQVDLDLDDIRQRLRIKVWKALRSYNRDKSRSTMERWVFSCVMNEKKDLLKARKDSWAYIEDQAPAGEGPDSPRDSFEHRYMSLSEEEAFRGGAADHLALPDSLDERECKVIVMLYAGRTRAEARSDLALTPKEMERVILSLREKLAAWRPAQHEPLPPLLRVVPELLSDEPSPVARSLCAPEPDAPGTRGRRAAA